jgi:hypothetical protein
VSRDAWGQGGGEPLGIPSPTQAVDGKAVGDCSTLARASRDVRILGHARRAVSVPVWHEPAVGSDETFVTLGPLLDVGLHEELPAGLEQARDVVEEVPLDEKALRVSLLPPGIREVDEEPTHRTVGAKTGQRDPRVFGEDTGTRSEPSSRQTPVDDCGPLAANFQPNERRSRLGLGAFDQEPTSPRAELDLDPVHADEARRAGARRVTRERANIDAVALGQAGGVVIRTKHAQPLPSMGVRTARLTRARYLGDRPGVHGREAWKARALVYGPLVLAVAFVAERTIAALLAKVGHAAPTLDDAYIHFQYAKAIATGHPLRFQANAPVTSGATSMLWPALLAPFWAMGARDDAIMWAAWALSFAALGGLAWEASQLTRRLAGRVAAAGAGAMTIAFGGFVWCAASGMEVLPFAWAIARASRLACEWAEADPSDRSSRRLGELVAMAWVAALFRPEGALTALFVAATLAVFPRLPAWRERAFALAAASSAFAVPLLLFVLTGSARSNTAVVKLLPGNPYYAGPALTSTVLSYAKMLVGTLLNGEAHAAEFLPRGGAPLAMAGLAAIAVLGIQNRMRWRAVAVLLIALTMFAPCFYYTFLWNRLRYLWPFATGWIIGLACLARLVGDLAGGIRPQWRVATGLACGAFVGLFASKLDWVIDDVAQSASGIDRQQVALGRWAARNLGPDARIGVNDTGAIAYFSDRTTFDVVGLTSAGEGRYWVAGAGSRLEHYERLHDAAPSELPTHFIVYPEWMAMDAVLGEPLKAATVTDSTILGGTTMRAYVADWSKLGTGEKPWTATSPASTLADALDVADLESESAHGYELLDARDGDEIAHEGTSPDGDTVVDGGRTRRTTDRFAVRLPSNVSIRGIVRLDGRSDTHVELFANGTPVGAFDLGGDEDWVEETFTIPADAVAKAHDDRTRFELRTDGAPVTTFHYWFFVTPG